MRLLLVFVVFIFSLSVNAQELKWDGGRLLKWIDFKGKSNESAAYVAWTNSSIKYSWKTDAMGNLSFKVDCIFNCQLSWKNSDKMSDYLLGHEQLHFDITELYARVLRKKFADLSESFTGNVNPTEKIRQIFAEVNEMRKDVDAKYDEETQHSINKEQQLLWRQKIDQQLKAYEAYAE